MITNWRNWQSIATRTGFAVLISCVSQVTRSPIVQADVIPDNTLGPENSQFNVNQVDGGATRGSNLFHSFLEFSIDEGQTLEFLPNNDIETIFTRVTGDSMSEILGTLGVSGEADFFLINPNGVFVGRNAKLDMDGSFLASTADGIEFGDAFLFSAQTPIAPPDSLLVVQPSALIFNQLNPSMIHSQGRLEVDRGEAIQLVGGDILLEDRDKTLLAREGLVEIGGLAAPGRVELSPEGTLQFTEDVARADVTLLNDASIEVDGGDGGTIRIYGHNLTLNDSEIQGGLDEEGDTPNSQSGDILIDLTGDLDAVDSEIVNDFDDDAEGTIGSIVLAVIGDINLEDTEIKSRIEGTGESGNIEIYAHDLTLNNSEIEAGLRREGTTPDSQSGDIIIVLTGDFQSSRSEIINNLDDNAEGTIGNIILTVAGNISLENTEIKNRIEGIGESGDIQIDAHDLTLTNSEIVAGIRDEAGTPDSQSGNIVINLTRNLLSVNSEIFNNLSEDAQGTIGSIILTVAGDISLLEETDIESQIEGTGDSGNIQIDAHNLTLNDSGIEGGFGSGGGMPDSQSGDVIINLSGDLYAFDSGISNELARGAQGTSGDIIVTVAGDIDLDSSDIESQLRGTTGENGDIRIYAHNLTLINKAKVEGGFNNNGGTLGRQAGDVIIVLTGDLEALNKSKIVNTLAGDAEGTSGNIDVDVAGDIYLENSQIENEVQGIGESGDIFVTAGGEIFLNGGQIRNRVSDNDGQGDSGDIYIVADSLRMETPEDDNNGDQALISTTTEEIGSAGDISIFVNEFTMIGPGESGSSGITSSASDRALGDAGSVLINVEGVMLMTDRGKIESVVQGGATGTGGNVTINAHSLILIDDSAIKVLNKANGEPGNIEINLTGDLILDDSDINGSVEGENAGSLAINNATGNVVINARAVRLSNGGEIKVLASDGAGNAGQLEVTADLIEIGEFDLEEISHSSSGFLTRSEASGEGSSSGAGGAIILNVRLLRLGTNAVIDSSTDGDFRGGDIEITAEQVELVGGGQLVASTLGSGQAGSINITASDEIFISGIASEDAEDTLTPSGIFTVTESSGSAGQIIVRDSGRSLDLIIQDGGIISAQALEQGNAGIIIINIADQLRMTDGDIRTDASQSAGGEIIISAGNIILSGDGDILTNVASGADNGGNIVIAADYLIALDDSDILAFAQDGAGGNITLPIFFGEDFVASPPGTDPNSLDLNDRVDVNASGQLSSGTITFPDVSFIENSLTELPDTLVNTDILVASSCIAAVAEDSGRLVLVGQDNLPQRPETTHVSTFPTGQVRSLPEESTTALDNGDSITEPQAIYQLSDGRLVMDRRCS